MTYRLCSLKTTTSNELEQEVSGILSAIDSRYQLAECISRVLS